MTTPGSGATADSSRHPLLFVHGAWHGEWCWKRHFVPWFAERGWACHSLDFRHHGAAGGPGSLRRSRIKHYVDDLASAVDGFDRSPILVAHSMGGLVAQRLLESRLLPGAVLLATVPVGGVWRATGRTIRRHPLKFLEANLRLDLGPLVDSTRMARSMLYDPDIALAEVERLQPMLQSESYLAYLDMLLVTRPRPPLVHTPVALIVGDQDRLFSVRATERTARAYGTEATVIPGAGHDLMLGPRWEQAAAAVLFAAEDF
ncbi:MAG: alpha/beta fold hydrolase [Acidimicrobiia bacterium]